jgi:hypothetical protein
MSHPARCLRKKKKEAIIAQKDVEVCFSCVGSALLLQALWVASWLPAGCDFALDTSGFGFVGTLGWSFSSHSWKEEKVVTF